MLTYKDIEEEENKYMKSVLKKRAMRCDDSYLRVREYSLY